MGTKELWLLGKLFSSFGTPWLVLGLPLGQWGCHWIAPCQLLAVSSGRWLYCWGVLSLKSSK